MALHIMLQGKGGVGKTTISVFLSQYLQKSGYDIECIDTDPVNASFAAYEGLNVKHIEIIKDKKIDLNEFEKLLQYISENPEKEYIIDNGAGSFVPLSNYLSENEILPLLSSMNIEVYIHTIIRGGTMLNDTMNGLYSLTDQFGNDAKIVVWLNEFNEIIENNGKQFKDSDVYKEIKSKIDKVITLAQQSEMFADSIAKMLSEDMTFEEIKAASGITFMEKNRLSIFERKISESLSPAFPPKKEDKKPEGKNSEAVAKVG